MESRRTRCSRDVVVYSSLRLLGPRPFGWIRSLVEVERHEDSSLEHQDVRLLPLERHCIFSQHD